MPILLSELSEQSKNKLITSVFFFNERHDIDQARQGRDAIWYYRGITPLIYAVYTGDFVLIQELVESGANLNKKDDTYGFTPLMWAARDGKHLIVEYLLAQRAEVSHIVEVPEEDGYRYDSATSLSQKDPCCSAWGFWQRKEELCTRGINFDRTHELIVKAQQVQTQQMIRV
jgi:hypothetical protein